MYHRFGAFQVNFLVEGFYTRLSDVFVLENIGERDGILIKERRNGSGAKVLGLSMEGKMAYLSLFQLQAGVTLQQSRYDEPEKWKRNGTGREEDFPYTEYLWILYGNVYADQASLIIPVGHVHRLDAGAAHGRLY